MITITALRDYHQPIECNNMYGSDILAFLRKTLAYVKSLTFSSLFLVETGLSTSSDLIFFLVLFSSNSLSDLLV